MKKLVIVLLLLLALPMQAFAAENVQSMVEELPEVSVLREMDMEQQREVYDRTQAAYEAYLALSEEEQAAVDEQVFEALFGYFNTLVMPLEAAEEETTAASAAAEKPAEGGTGSDILSTAIAVCIGIFLARKLVTKKKI